MEETHDRRNSFIFGLNKRKRAGKKDPEWEGTFTDENGDEFWMSIWPPRMGPKGEYFTGGMKRKQAQGNTGQSNSMSRPRTHSPGDEDDLP